MSLHFKFPGIDRRLHVLCFQSFPIISIIHLLQFEPLTYFLASSVVVSENDSLQSSLHVGGLRPCDSEQTGRQKHLAGQASRCLLSLAFTMNHHRSCTHLSYHLTSCIIFHYELDGESPKFNRKKTPTCLFKCIDIFSVRYINIHNFWV